MKILGMHREKNAKELSTHCNSGETCLAEDRADHDGT